MKQISILLCFLAVCSCASAQQTSFVRTINEEAVRVVPGKNGTFYMLSMQLACPDDHIIVRFCSRQGDVLKAFKSYAYPASTITCEGVVNDNNHLVLYIRFGEINHSLYEFDSAGTMLWNTNLQFTNPVIKYSKISLAPNGYFLLGNTKWTTYTDSSRAVLTKLTLNGKHAWSKFYRMNNTLASSTNFHDMLYDNNKLILVGRYYYTSQVVGQAPYRPIVTLADTAGNLQQSFYYMVDSGFTGFEKWEFRQIDKTPNGSYYLLAWNFGNEHCLFKMDPSWNIQWVKEKLSGKAYAMCAGYNEDMFLVPDYAPNNYVLQFDSTGTVLPAHTTKIFPGSYIEYGSITNIKRHDCGFLLSSTEHMYAHTNKQMSYCADSLNTSNVPYYAITNHYRRDASLSSGAITSFNEYLMTAQYVNEPSSGSILCSQTYNCSGGNPNPQQVSQVQTLQATVYPNPASDVLNIIFPAPGNYDVQVYDMSGRGVIQKIVTNSTDHIVPLYSLPTGLYTLKIVGENNVYVQQIEVVK